VKRAETEEERQARLSVKSGATDILGFARGYGLATCCGPRSLGMPAQVHSMTYIEAVDWLFEMFGIILLGLRLDMPDLNEPERCAPVMLPASVHARDVAACKARAFSAPCICVVPESNEPSGLPSSVGLLLPCRPRFQHVFCSGRCWGCCDRLCVKQRGFL